MFYAQLNGFRFIFIFLVLLEHWLPRWVYNHLESGSLGVNLFFVMSGFLIGEILLLQRDKQVKRSRSIYTFYSRRALRIFPLYYMVLLLYAVFFTTGGILKWNATYTTNILECLNADLLTREFAHLWSLCVEEQFYMLFPFLIFFLPNKIFLRLLVAMILISFVFRFSVTELKFGNYTAYSYRLLPACFDCLLGGVSLAYLKCYHLEKLNRFFSKKTLVFSLIGLSLVLVPVLKLSNNDLMMNTLFRLNSGFLGILLIGYSVITGFKGLTQLFLENKFISYLGKISYGIYLFHPFIHKIYFDHFPVDRLIPYADATRVPIYLINFMFLTGLTIVLSTLSYEFYEKRFLLLKRYF
jgi:peptidoglycan/LPS O-acetylase OafA/YrhL